MPCFVINPVRYHKNEGHSSNLLLFLGLPPLLGGVKKKKVCEKKVAIPFLLPNSVFTYLHLTPIYFHEKTRNSDYFETYPLFLTAVDKFFAKKGDYVCQKTYLCVEK